MLKQVPVLRTMSARKRQRVGSLLGWGIYPQGYGLLFSPLEFLLRQVLRDMVDTGVTVSLVKRQFVPDPLIPSSLKARGIGGEELQVHGQADFNSKSG